MKVIPETINSILMILMQKVIRILRLCHHLEPRINVYLNNQMELPIQISIIKVVSNRSNLVEIYKINHLIIPWLKVAAGSICKREKKAVLSIFTLINLINNNIHKNNKTRLISKILASLMKTEIYL